jgi:hypothetical protein
MLLMHRRKVTLAWYVEPPSCHVVVGKEYQLDATSDIIEQSSTMMTHQWGIESALGSALEVDCSRYRMPALRRDNRTP